MTPELAGLAPQQAMDKKLKILFVSDVYFPRVNGVSTSIQTFITQLQALGHTVHLIAPDYGLTSEQIQDEPWIRRVASRKIFFDPEDYLMRYRPAMALIPELASEGYDLVHVNTPFVAHYFGKQVAKRLNIPCIETYHTFFEDYLHHYLPWVPTLIARMLARAISKKQCNAVNAIVSPSKPMLDVLHGYGVNVPAVVIPTGLEATSFSEQDIEFKKKYGIDPARPLLLYVGRVAHEKNIEFLLGVVDVLKAELPDLLLLITGEGPALQSLLHKVDLLGIRDNVMFLGYLDRYQELNACYAAADVFVFASTSETQGLVVLEAMAQGTPVVAIAELGTASILVDGKGALIAVEETLDFAEKVQSLLNDKAKRQALGKKALAYAQEEWTAEHQAQRMHNFYQMITQAYQAKQLNPLAEPVVSPAKTTSS